MDDACATRHPTRKRKFRTSFYSVGFEFYWIFLRTGTCHSAAVPPEPEAIESAHFTLAPLVTGCHMTKCIFVRTNAGSSRTDEGQSGPPSDSRHYPATRCRTQPKLLGVDMFSIVLPSFQMLNAKKRCDGPIIIAWLASR